LIERLRDGEMRRLRDKVTGRDLPEFRKPGRVCEGMEVEISVAVGGDK